MGLWLAGAALLSAQSTHTIKSGDTYYSLSRQYGVSVAQLREANPGIDPAALRIGQTLKIPVTTPPPAPAAPPPARPEFHTVVRGETLSAIARKYSMTITELRSLNNLSSDIIRVGQRLRLRGKAAPPPPQYTFVVGDVRRQIDRPRIGSRKWEYIVVHHSGTRSGSAKIFDYYHRRVRGMENGMAYHFVIGNGTDTGDGAIEVGERWFKQLQGGHVRSDAQNNVAIGICLVGDFERNRPTRRQIASLIELVNYLRQRTGAPYPRFVTHRQINITPTTCPGRQFPTQAMTELFGR